MMNWMTYGTSSYLPPEAELVLNTRATREGVDSLNDRGAESLLQLRDMDDDIRRGNHSLEQLEKTSGMMVGSLDSISSGLGELDSHFREGFSDMSNQLSALGWEMEHGFAGVNEMLQSGFESVVAGLAIVDERLGQRLAAHFGALQEQLDEQHEALLTTLDNGFNQVSQAVLLSAEYLGKVITANAEAQMRQMAREGDETRRLIAETSQRQITKMEEVRQAMVHQDAHRAEEHFIVGLNDFNHGDLRRAYLHFLKAERIFGGHFPTLFMLGFSQYLINRFNTAHKYFQTALHQAQTVKQRGLASFYIARLYFTAKKFDQAQNWYVEAFQYDRNFVMTALVEWAAARLLWNETRHGDANAVAAEITERFGEYGGDAQYQYWYALALTLTPLDAEWAAAAFRQGATLDSAGAAKKNRKRVMSVLRWLNIRHVDALIALVKHDFAWLG